MDRVKDSKSSKPEKTKFWPGSEWHFPSCLCPDPKGSLELRGLRWSVPGVCWDLTGVCTTGGGTKASLLAWPAGSVPFILLFSSPAWGQHHTQTDRQCCQSTGCRGEHHSLVQESRSYRPQCQHPSYPACSLCFWPINHTRQTHRKVIPTFSGDTGGSFGKDRD